jgi:phenylacetate-coenzyme A ligase PaaK-like adenylate-forming protein
MSQPYWDPQLETLSPERRALLREHRLHWQVRRCWDGSSFYRARLEAVGIDPTKFGGLTDLPRIPILRIADLPETSAWAVAPESWWDHVDGAPGYPVRVVTDGDAIQQADLAARSLWAAGARPGQMFPLPSAELDPLVRSAILAGAGRIRAALGPADDLFVPMTALPFAAPLASRCREGDRLHWNDDHFLIEVVDPYDGNPISAGEAGALLVTDLAREGSPLLRFWTGQGASAPQEERCPCGRTSAQSRSLGLLSVPARL